MGRGSSFVSAECSCRQLLQKMQSAEIGAGKNISEILLRVTYTGAYLGASRGEGEETEKDESDSTEDARWSELKKDEAVEPIQEQLLLETS